MEKKGKKKAITPVPLLGSGEKKNEEGPARAPIIKKKREQCAAHRRPAG